MNSFNLTITAVDKSVFNGEVTFCQVFTPSGAIGLEARHEAFMTILKENSSIKFTETSGMENSCKVESGLLAFQDNKCLITVSISSVS